MLWALVLAVSVSTLGHPVTRPSIEPTGGLTEQITRARAEIQRHDERYHREADPEISDAEYDELKRELRDLETQAAESGGFVGSRHISSTDDRRDGSSGYAHGERMRSLGKAYTESELNNFYKGVVLRLSHEPTFVIEPKFDGIAVSAVYVNGTLAHVLTRGDGVRGEEVMANAIEFASVPRKLLRSPGQDFPASIELRGEIFMTFVEFKRLNGARERTGELSHASPRNLAAGTLRSSDPELIGARTLEAVFYGIGTCNPSSLTPASQQELLSQIQAWGLRTPDCFRVARSFAALWASIEELKSVRREWAFPSDGVVVKVDLRADQQILGIGDEGPHWAVAFKFAAERRTTRLQAISLQVGRTGVITPVAELAPVQLGGATITRANLHNADEIARRDLRIGDHVIVERGGEIIPAIVAVDLTRREKDSVPFIFPTTCPSCGRDLVQREKKVAWRCTNEHCADQIERRVRHFASPAGVGIRGLGPATIEKLVDSGCVQNVSDLYTLTGAHLSSVLGEPASTVLLEAIDQSRSVEISRVVQGLGIEGVGPKVAKLLCERFVTLDALAAAQMVDLQRISGISTKDATRIGEFFASEEGRRLLVVLRSAPISR